MSIGALGQSEAGGLPAISDREFEDFRALIHRETGIALGESKRALLCARLGKRLRHFGLATYGDYFRHVTGPAGQQGELTELINAITTNKTDFFRERNHFEYLQDVVVPAFLARSPNRPLRVWSSASSTGEEPYTIAMTLAEALEMRGVQAKVLASDIDTQVLAHARAGVYGDDRVADVPPELLRKYFLRGKGAHSGQLKVKPEISNMVDFRQVNLIADEWDLPEEQFDVIFCRNVVIYFDRETQRKLFDRFADRLAPDGYLFIGHSESLHGISERLSSVRGTIYRHATQRGGSRPGDRALAERPVQAMAPAPQAKALVAPPKTVQRASGASAPARPSRLVAAEGLPEKSIVVGEVEATKSPSVIRTLLGSCVSACLFDPQSGAGGMNHFLLPIGQEDEATSTRYGAYAMEVLINELMHLGVDRRRLRAKVFGAGEVLRFQGNTPRVASANAKFVREFLATEGIPIVAERLGGTLPLEVRFMPHTGQVFVRAVESRNASAVADEEERFSKALAEKLRAEAATASNVDLF